VLYGSHRHEVETNIVHDEDGGALHLLSSERFPWTDFSWHRLGRNSADAATLDRDVRAVRHPLALPILKNLEIVSPKVRDVVPIPVRDHGVNLNQRDCGSKDGSRLIWNRGWLLSVGSRTEDGSQSKDQGTMTQRRGGAARLRKTTQRATLPLLSKRCQ
jgi:hypothetical protein